MMKRWWKGSFLLLFLLIVLAVPAGAATKKSTFASSGGYYYYYNAKGKKVTGLKTIGGKQYYFDEAGVQRIGWRYLNGSYCFFKAKYGKKGYMVKKAWVDGIYLNKNGKATGGQDELRKLRVLATAQKIVETNTRATASKSEKRKTMYDYTKTHYKNVIIADLVNSNKYWDVAYAERLFSTGSGDCYAYAAGFAYFLNAIGYDSVYLEHSGTHAWVTCGGKYFDPHWDMTYKTNKCYAVTEAKAGVAGRPNWPEIFIGAMPIDEMGW